MLRPILAFAALGLVAFLLAPTVANVHAQVDALHIKRDNVWHIWKWSPPESSPPPPPSCDGNRPLPTAAEVTVYSTKMAKDQPYTLGGVVTSPEEGGKGVPGDRVEVYLNETKESPGRPIGAATTNGEGQWTLTGTLPFEMQANHYHIVAHANNARDQCRQYHESWSDPEVNVTARSRVILDGPFRSVAGYPVNITGSVVDDVGAPVTVQPVRVSVGGQTVMVTTDGSGRFVATLAPMRTGDVPVQAFYQGNAYYASSSNSTVLHIEDEAILLDGQLPNGTIAMVRSTPLNLTGFVLLRPNASYAPVTLAFRGILVRECPTCPPRANVTFDVGPDGAFQVTLFADRNQTAGAFAILATGGGLRHNASFAGALSIPTYIDLATGNGGPLSKDWSGTLALRDDVGPLAGAPVALLGPSGWSNGLTNGTAAFHATGTAPACGPGVVQAFYNGTDTRLPVQAAQGVDVCGAALAHANALRLGLPWWGWLLVLLASLAAWIAWRRLRARFAATISEGPPLTLAFAEPRDAAQGVVGLGEAATIVAFLEAPLPEGARLRLGTPERMEDVAPEGLEARMALVSDRLGDVPVRAEIVDAKGRVVTRRTRALRVVRYAEEIERRYLALRATRVGERADRVTPREFERWLRERSAGLDPGVAQRLVGLFEEADYGPRVATRRELLAYIDAESALPEVSLPALE